MELTLDCETETYNKGNPFDSRGGLVSVHAYYEGSTYSYRPHEMERIPRNEAKILILFNAKFDLHWLRKNGLEFDIPIWDVQLAHFMLRNQLTKFPSLDDVLIYYNLPVKFDKVKELWDQGVQTSNIDWDILCEYGEGDVLKTYQCYQKQVEEFKQDPQLFKLFRLCCKDTYVLAEMEWNGLKFNREKCASKSREIQKNINKLVGELSSVYPGISINFGSNDQLSAYLYGGTIKEEVREIIGFYKTGNKIGSPRFKVSEVEHPLPRLFTPIRGSEMAKEGIYSTSADTLKKLKGKHKWIVDHLLELAKLSKLNETYFDGLPSKNEQYHWPENMLHPQYNQCVAVSGRLSSSNPNGQNLSGDVLEVFESRYGSI